MQVRRVRGEDGQTIPLRDKHVCHAFHSSGGGCLERINQPSPGVDSFSLLVARPFSLLFSSPSSPISESICPKSRFYRVSPAETAAGGRARGAPSPGVRLFPLPSSLLSGFQANCQSAATGRAPLFASVSHFTKSQ